MVNYPYQASFLGNLPAWPVTYSCNLLINETRQGVDIITAIKDLAGVLYNDSTSDCFDIYAQFIEVESSKSSKLKKKEFKFSLFYQVCRSDFMWTWQ